MGWYNLKKQLKNQPTAMNCSATKYDVTSSLTTWQPSTMTGYATTLNCSELCCAILQHRWKIIWEGTTITSYTAKLQQWTEVLLCYNIVECDLRKYNNDQFRKNATTIKWSAAVLQHCLMLSEKLQQWPVTIQLYNNELKCWSGARCYSIVECCLRKYNINQLR